MPTNFETITKSPEVFAKAIVEWQKSDPSINWCKDEFGCATMDDNFICTDEMQASCVLRWLNTQKQPGTCESSLS